MRIGEPLGWTSARGTLICLLKGGRLQGTRPHRGGMGTEHDEPGSQKLANQAEIRDARSYGATCGRPEGTGPESHARDEVSGCASLGTCLVTGWSRYGREALNKPRTGGWAEKGARRDTLRGMHKQGGRIARGGGREEWASGGEGN